MCTDLWGLYARSRFCLQPIGDTCARKGMVDAMLMGCAPTPLRSRAASTADPKSARRRRRCIPVIFYECGARLWPLHWQSWRNESSIFIDGDKLISGELNVVEELAAVPEARQQHMREVIAANAHKLVYSFEEPETPEGDALSLIFEAVAKSSPDDTLGARPSSWRYVGDRLNTPRDFIAARLCSVRHFDTCATIGVLEILFVVTAALVALTALVGIELHRAFRRRN